MSVKREPKLPVFDPSRATPRREGRKPYAVDLTGSVFDNVKVVAPLPKSPSGVHRYVLYCLKCGVIFRRTVKTIKTAERDGRNLCPNEGCK